MNCKAKDSVSAGAVEGVMGMMVLLTSVGPVLLDVRNQAKVSCNKTTVPKGADSFPAPSVEDTKLIHYGIESRKTMASPSGHGR